MSVIQFEQLSEDAFRVKRCYIDMTDDLVSGILLGQIIFWYLPNEDGKSKLRVFKDDHYWIAKERSAWFDEIRITPKQYDRAIKVLIDKEFVVTKRFKFNGQPIAHIRLNIEKVNQAFKEISSVRGGNGNSLLGNSGIDEKVIPESTKGQSENSPLGNPRIDEKVIPLTEITTETTSEITTETTSEITTETTTRETSDSRLEKLVEHYQNQYGNIPALVLTAMDKFLQKGFEAEVIMRAVDLAVERGKRWDYAAGILRRLEDEHNAKTLEAYEYVVQKKNQRTNNVSNHQKVPDWLEKDEQEQRVYEKRKSEELMSDVPTDEELMRQLQELRTAK